MTNYALIRKNSKTGLIGISKDSFIHIGEHALKRVKEKYKMDLTSIESKEKLITTLKESEVLFSLSIELNEKINPDDFQNDFIEILSNNLTSLCEGMKYKILVKFIETPKK